MHSLEDRQLKIDCRHSCVCNGQALRLIHDAFILILPMRHWLNATLLLVLAAPCLLGNGPSTLPVGVPSVAVIGFGDHTAHFLVLAAPCLLGHRPSTLPVGVPSVAVIGLGCNWCDWCRHRWYHNWHHLWDH